MSILSSVISGATGSFNPLSWIKWAAYAALAAAAMFLVYKGISFVETAEANAAKVGVLTSQLSVAAQTNADNIIAMAATEKQHAAVVASANAVASDQAQRAAGLQQQLAALARSPRSTGCTPSPAAKALLDGLRH